MIAKRHIGIALAAVIAMSILALMGFVVVLFPPGSRSAKNELPQVTLGSVTRAEGCLVCHATMRGLGGAHDAIGCSPCHLGDPSARDQNAAHRGLEVLAGDFATVAHTCGQALCHAIETARSRSSLMARAPGILAVDRFAFGERDTPTRDASDDLSALDANAAPQSMAESHTRKLCATCHLGARKPRPGDLGDEARGGGCTACHLAPPIAAARTSGGPLHPEVSAIVPERRCAGCHGRSGRISMSYRGIAEVEPDDPRANGSTSDGRRTTTTTKDVHARAGMSCTDCHVERELMGSGNQDSFAHEALEVRCVDCHAVTKNPAEIDADRERVAEVLRRSWARRGLPALSNTPLRSSRGTPLVRSDATTRSLMIGTTGERRSIPIASDRPWHTMRGHERLSCSSCHASWAPRCRSCHTSFDPTGSDIDHLSGKITAGHWTERAGQNGFGPPLLAIDARGEIAPFVEGMRLTIEIDATARERTLYAPLEPHTTSQSRTCSSCHERVDEVFPSDGELTRPGARRLDRDERGRVARVGRCLTCHATYDDKIYVDFATSLKRITPRCIALK